MSAENSNKQETLGPATAALLREESFNPEDPFSPNLKSSNSGITGDNDPNGLNLPPGRMHATRVPQRLSGSSGNLAGSVAQHHHVRRKSGDNISRSRSRSPSMKTETTRTHKTTVTENSSISSLEDYFDNDLLTDRAGFEELDYGKEVAEARKLHNSREFVNLPPVNERMTEDTLEDVHAFSDVRSSNASRANSVSIGGEAALQPLDECEEEGSDLDESDSSVGPSPQIILTNMENLTLESDAARAETGRGTRGTGGSSLLEEAPSAPTA
jgi:hypothetical protein